MPRAQLVRGFWNSAEHRGRQVDTLYAAILDRSVDAAGRAHWVHALQTGLSEVDLSRTMLLSPEYRAARGDTRAFVEGLYLDILGRPADPRGLASWMAASHFPHSRGRILREFLEAPESHVHAVDDYFAWLLKTNVL